MGKKTLGVAGHVIDPLVEGIKGYQEGGTRNGLIEAGKRVDNAVVGGVAAAGCAKIGGAIGGMALPIAWLTAPAGAIIGGAACGYFAGKGYDHVEKLAYNKKNKLRNKKRRL